MNNFSMNQGSHNNPPPSPHMPRDGNNNPNNNSNSNSNSHHNGASSSSSSSTTTTTTGAGFGTRRTIRNKELDKKIQQMALPLAPLVQLTSGHVHPAFPSTLLNFWLLTDDQLDELAQFYHQRSPCQWTRHYPCPISWAEGLTVEEKRRKMGKFIGLRGCDTPILLRTEEQIMEAARQARIKADENEVLRRKAQGYY